MDMEGGTRTARLAISRRDRFGFPEADVSHDGPHGGRRRGDGNGRDGAAAVGAIQGTLHAAIGREGATYLAVRAESLVELHGSSMAVRLRFQFGRVDEVIASRDVSGIVLMGQWDGQWFVICDRMTETGRLE